MRVLIIIPGMVSYFYDSEGKRLAEALRNLGCHVDICTLFDYEQHTYDWCFLMNLSEISFAHGHDTQALIAHIQQLQSLCGKVAMVLLECVEMTWFNDSFKLFQQAKMDTLIDLGFHDQKARAAEEVKPVYHFLFNGLTHSERAQAEVLLKQVSPRPIPWAFVGHMTPIRLELLELLLDSLDKGGFVYMVRFTPVTEDGPHLNERQLKAVLKKTRYNVWSTHHQYFYLESIRFRQSLLTGCVPIKIDLLKFPIDEDYPFGYLILNRDNLSAHMQAFDFEAIRQRFHDDFYALPSLEDEMSRFLGK